MPVFNGKDYKFHTHFAPWAFVDNWDPFFSDVLTELDGRRQAIAESGEAAADAAAQAQQAAASAGVARDVMAGMLTAANEANDLAISTMNQIKTDTEGLKGQTQTLRNETEGFKSDAQAAVAALSLPIIAVADAGKGLEVKPDGSGWQLVSYLKAAGGTLTGWLQANAGIDATNLGLRIGETTSGFYRSAVGVVGFVANNVEVFRTAASGALLFYRAVRGQIVALPWSSTITIDANAGNYFSVTLGGATTFANPSNLTAGQPITVIIKQPPGGGCTGSWGSHWKFPNNTAPILSTAGGKTDRVVGHAIGATEIHAVAVKGF